MIIIPKRLVITQLYEATIMKDGILSTKEKDLLLVGMNAARLYERSMVYHTKSAMNQGATIPELVEYLLIPYVYNGEEALKIAFKSIETALSFQDTGSYRRWFIRGNSN